MKNELTIQIRSSPELVTVLRGLRAASNALELIPDWHQSDKVKLQRRLKKAFKVVRQSLEAR